jgi:hypothetical protein
MNSSVPQRGQNQRSEPEPRTAPPVTDRGNKQFHFNDFAALSDGDRWMC